MKCKVCGHRSTTISAMAKHYRLKHPNKMKHGAKGSKRGKTSSGQSTKALLKELLSRLG